MAMAKKRSRLSEQIRQALNDCGLTRYRIWKETGISQVTLSRFVNGERGLPMKTLDRLADFLDLNISIGPGYPGTATRTTHSSASRRKSTSPGSVKRRARQTASRGRQKKGK